MVRNISSEINDLLKRGDDGLVLRLLYNENIHQINPPYNESLNHAWYAIGDIFFNNKKFEKALSCFKQALLDWPEDVESIWAIANCYSEMGKSEKALEWLQKGLKLDPDNEALLYNYANALFDLGEYDKAISLYEDISDRSPDIYVLARRNIKKAKKERKKGKR